VLLQLGDQSQKLGAILLRQTVQEYFHRRAAIRVYVKVYRPRHDVYGIPFKSLKQEQTDGAGSRLEFSGGVCGPAFDFESAGAPSFVL
jgi:hypothetical protein